MLWVHDLIGSRVEDADGRVLGTVMSVEANPASDLLVLEAAVLDPLPLRRRHEPGERVAVDVPDGLLEPG